MCFFGDTIGGFPFLKLIFIKDCKSKNLEKRDDYQKCVIDVM